MKEITSKAIVQQENQNNFDVNYLFAIDKMQIEENKFISVKQSKFIFDRAKEFKIGKGVDWSKVILCFQFNGSQEKIIKKIKNHYYNKRAFWNRLHANRMKRLYYTVIRHLIRENNRKSLSI